MAAVPSRRRWGWPTGGGGQTSAFRSRSERRLTESNFVSPRRGVRSQRSASYRRCGASRPRRRRVRHHIWGNGPGQPVQNPKSRCRARRTSDLPAGDHDAEKIASRTDAHGTIESVSANNPGRAAVCGGPGRLDRRIGSGRVQGANRSSRNTMAPICSHRGMKVAQRSKHIIFTQASSVPAGDDAPASSPTSSRARRGGRPRARRAIAQGVHSQNFEKGCR